MKGELTMKMPIDEILERIRSNYVYYDGVIAGPYKRDIGEIHGGFIRITIEHNDKRRHIMRSHIVWFLCKGYWPRQRLKHKDGNKMNDKIENLEEA